MRNRRGLPNGYGHALQEGGQMYEEEKQIVVKYVEKFYYDFVKFDKHYRKYAWVENYDVFTDPVEVKKLSCRRDTRIVWTEEHPLF